MIVLRSKLLHAWFLAWTLLSEQLEEAGLGPLAATLTMNNVMEDAVGLLGYTVHTIARTAAHTRAVRIVFAALNGADEVAPHRCA
jgi:hypothetical protein